jgi:molecular chaperone GrpE
MGRRKRTRGDSEEAAEGNVEDAVSAGGLGDRPTRQEAVPSQEPPEPQEVTDLRRQLAEKEELAKAYFAQLQRVQADFENYQKRMGSEMSRISDQACGALIAGLLDTLDNFERAVAHLEGLPDESAKGVVMVYQAMLSYLRENGLERIASAGCQFDPRKHEAIMQTEDAAAPDGTVLEEFQAGYSVKGRVVRPTKVKVSRRPAEDVDVKKDDIDEKKEE